jgi:hypothetical protein
MPRVEVDRIRKAFASLQAIADDAYRRFEDVLRRSVLPRISALENGASS